MAGSNAAGTDELEVEMQFVAGDLAAVESWLRRQPPQALLEFEARPEIVQRDAYLDTEAWDVYRAGFSLRVRRKSSGAEATLKALAEQTPGAVSRREISQPVEAEAPDLLAGDGPVSQRLRLVTRGRPLRTLFQIETQRLPFLIRQLGNTLAELTLDDATLIDLPEAPPVRRLEIEQTRVGGLAALQQFVPALMAACNLTPAPYSKFRAGLLAAGLMPRTLPDLGATDRDAGDSAGASALASLRRYAADFLLPAPATLLGEDPEALHDMRVATRRLRAALKAYDTALPLELTGFDAELKWVGGVLSEVRDLDVQIEGLRTRQASAPWEQANALGALIEQAAASRETSRERLVTALTGARYDALVAGLTAALRSPAAQPPGAELPIQAFIEPVLRRRFKKLSRRAEALTPDSEAPVFHAVRIASKRLRYTVELVADIYGRPAQRLVDAAKAVQDVLGEAQDMATEIPWLRSLALQDGTGFSPATLVFIGELLEQERVRMLDLRLDAGPKLRRLRRRWRSFRDHLVTKGAEEPAATSEDAGATPVPVGAPVVPARSALLQRLFGRMRPQP